MAVRDRWSNVLNPRIDPSPLTYEEQQLILREYKRYGNQFAKIAEKLPKRTCVQIKNFCKAHADLIDRRDSDDTSSSQDTEDDHLDYAHDDERRKPTLKFISENPTFSTQELSDECRKKGFHVCERCFPVHQKIRK